MTDAVDVYIAKRRKLMRRVERTRNAVLEAEEELERVERDNMDARVRVCTLGVTEECAHADEYHVGWLMRREDADLLKAQTPPGVYAFLSGTTTVTLLRAGGRDERIEDTAFSPAPPDPDRGNYVLRTFEGVTAAYVRAHNYNEFASMVAPSGTVMHSVCTRALVCVFLNKPLVAV